MPRPAYLSLEAILTVTAALAATGAGVYVRFFDWKTTNAPTSNEENLGTMLLVIIGIVSLSVITETIRRVRVLQKLEDRSEEVAKTVHRVEAMATAELATKSDLSTLAADLQALVPRQDDYSPARSYPASRTISARFNEDLMKDFEASASYLFRGGTGRYVPSRLKRLARIPPHITVALIDPARDHVVEQRAHDRVQQRRDLDFAMACKEIRDQIFMCIVGLFELRKATEVEIAVGEDTSALRYEIFDGAAYVSLYHGTDESFRFPETVRFEANSRFYRSFRTDCERHAKLGRRFVFNGKSPNAKLVECLRSLGAKDADDEFVARMKQAHEQFSGDFHASLNTTAPS